MRHVIEQRIPGGGYSPEAQVVLSLAVVREAARLLEFSALDELENALAALRKPLVALTGAGVLASLSFQLQDEQGTYGVTAVFHPYDVADMEEADLSGLALLAGPEAGGCLEIACPDMPLAAAIVGEGYLSSLSTESLSVTQVNQSSSGGEDIDEYADEY